MVVATVCIAIVLAYSPHSNFQFRAFAAQNMSKLQFITTTLYDYIVIHREKQKHQCFIWSFQTVFYIATYIKTVPLCVSSVHRTQQYPMTLCPSYSHSVKWQLSHISVTNTTCLLQI